jgi:hypothetical protein
LDRRLETLLVEPRTAPAWTRTQRKIVRRRRIGQVAVAGSMAFVVALLGALSLIGDDQATRVDTGPAGPTDPADPSAPAWTRLPEAGLGTGEVTYPVLVGAGDALYGWASSATGDRPLDALAGGTAYDATSDAWQPLDAPLAGGLGYPGAVGVGDEVLFVGTGTEAQRWSPETTESWPFELRDGCSSAPVEAEGRWWFACGTDDPTAGTGLQSVSPPSGDWQDHGTPDVSIAYPEVSVDVVGSRLYLYGSATPLEASGDAAVIAAFDLEASEWVDLPPVPLPDAAGHTVAATADQVVAVSGGLATVLDLEAGEWSDPVEVEALVLPPEVPEPFGCIPATAYALADRLVLVGCEALAVLEEDGRWRTEPLPFAGHQAAATVVGGVLYLAGSTGDVWAYVP